MCVGYRSEDLEDLQAQLYASIYYESNIESNTEVAQVTRFNVTGKSNEMENQQEPENTQFTESETIKGRYH